ncbi:MAG TPA: phosphatase PAP2 family protein [Verrucomicrobiae bacterium]
MKLINIRFSQSLPIACLAVWLLAIAPLPALADLTYLTPGKPDAATLLAPPPLIDSPEQAADMAEVKAVYHAADKADKQAAYSEKKFTVFNFTAAVGNFFIETNLPKTAAFFEKVQLDAETVTDLGKNYFHRPRPYATDTNLINGKLEKSFSYPSGHSTESMVLALVLAEADPAQHDTIIAHARLMGWHRVEIARHYPTDIYAGRVLAQAIVGEMNKNETFEKELAEVRNEIEAARKTAQNH